MIKYIAATQCCNLYDLYVSKTEAGKITREYICSPSEAMLNDLIREVKTAMEEYWEKHSSVFVAGKYYWITTDYKGHLRTIHVKKGRIPDNVDNLPFNYFKQYDEARVLWDRLSKLFEKYVPLEDE